MRMNCGAECANFLRKQQQLEREHSSVIDLMSSVLSCAFLEWILMFLLFINALFSFLVTQFARLCKLQTPCLLCSSLDHILLPSHADKTHFYNDLICHSHKKEIAVLTYCPTHSKLTAANIMTDNGYLCEECCSGIFHSVEKKNDSIFLSSSSSSSSVTSLKQCSCCSVLIERKSPLPQAPRIDKCMDDDDDDDDKSMIVEKTMENSNSYHQSEIANQLSDDIVVNHLPPSADGYYHDHIAEKHEERLDKCIKPHHIPLLVPVDTTVDSTLLASKENLESVDDKITGSGNLIITQTSTSNSNAIPSQTMRDVGTGSNIDLNDTYKLATGDKSSTIPFPTVTEVITESDSSKLYKDLKTQTSTHDLDAIASQTTRDVGPSSNMDMNDAYKFATGNTSSTLPSPTVTEVITGRDSSKVYEDLRLLVSQFSAARGIGSPWAELSPSPRVLHDPSNNAILQHITKSLSIDRNESGLESLDRSSSIVSEIEGESVADRLKRQIDLDRKSMYLLYKELEEERNASAVAAYQAMAMITRLQEEKASMHMEALQYQRMMEEQSEYDQEAVLKLNQVVTEKEKEVQDLEVQLAFFRKQESDDIDFVFDGFEKSDIRTS